MAETAVLGLLQGQNKPFGLQQLVDLLAHAGIKKAAITKALDALCESGKVQQKEFGKTKIWFPTQSELAVRSKEEMDAMRASAKQLQEELQEERGGLKTEEQELSSWTNSLTVAQIQASIADYTEKTAEKRRRLEQLKGGAVLISKKERDEVVNALTKAVNAWKKRKGMFKDAWNQLSENIDGKQSDLFEEMGVETDDAACANLESIEKLLPKAGPGLKRPRG